MMFLIPTASLLGLPFSVPVSAPVFLSRVLVSVCPCEPSVLPLSAMVRRPHVCPFEPSVLPLSALVLLPHVLASFFPYQPVALPLSAPVFLCPDDTFLCPFSSRLWLLCVASLSPSLSQPRQCLLAPSSHAQPARQILITCDLQVYTPPSVQRYRRRCLHLEASSTRALDR